MLMTQGPSTLPSPSAHEHAWTVQPLPSGGLHQFAQTWRELWLIGFAEQPLLAPRFVDTLLAHYPAEHLCMAKLWRGPQLVGMLIVQADTPRRGVWTSYLPINAQIGLALLPDNAPMEKLLDVLPGRPKRLDLLCTDPLHGDQRGESLLLRRVKAHALTMHIDLERGVEAYWQSRSSKLLSNLRRLTRRANDQGIHPQLRCSESPEELRTALQRYAVMESAGWKGESGTAVREGSVQFDFYNALLAVPGAEGQAMAYELWCGEELLASRLVLRCGGTAVMLKTTYSESHAEVAPGRLLLQQTINALAAQGCRRIEFYTDAQPDLLAWASGQRWINHVEIYRHRLHRLVLAALRRSRRLSLGRTDPSSLLHDPRVTVEALHPLRLPGDVREFMERMGRLHIDLTPDWFALMARTVFKDDAGIVLYVLRHAGKPVALLPVQRGGRQLQALGNYYTSYWEPLLAVGIGAHELAPMMRYLRALHPEVAMYRFGPMDPLGDPFAHLLGAMRLAGLRAFPYFAFGNWYLPGPLEWNAFLGTRSGKARNTLKRQVKAFHTEGGSVSLCTGGSELDSELAAFEKVYQRSWKTAEPYPEFVRGLAALTAARGGLRMATAWYQGQPIASQIWYVEGRRACIFKLAYDEDFKQLSAGTVLTMRLLEHVMTQDRVLEVDYLIGDDAYKARWMSHRRERWGLVAYDLRSPAGVLLWLRKSATSHLKRWLPERWLLRRQGQEERSNTPSGLTPPTPDAPAARL